jgi:DNA excision repair protein ERCC-6
MKCCLRRRHDDSTSEVLRKVCNHPDLVCDPRAGSVESIQKNGFPVGPSAANDSDDDDDEDDEIIGMKDYDEESAVERAGKLEVLSKILPLWKVRFI